MGTTKGKRRHPRHGSMQFWPRKRAKRIYPTVGAWAKSGNVSLLGFAGYKAGMTHIVLKDSRANSVTKGDLVVWPVSVIECPALKVFSIRLYKNTAYGAKVIGEVVSNRLDKEIAKKIDVAKDYKFDDKLRDVEMKECDDVRIAVYTQPKKTGLLKKKPEIFEIAIGGNDTKQKLEYAKSLLNKEIRAGDFAKSWNSVDIHAVTKGKGFGGSIKRYGYSLKSHKSKRKRRTIGNLGAEGEAKVRFTVGFPGQIGFHKRTEYNKMVVFVGDKPEMINPKGGFVRYGNVKNDYVLVKGSVPGALKRLVRFNEPIRGKRMLSNLEVVEVNLRSKQ